MPVGRASRPLAVVARARSSGFASPSTNCLYFKAPDDGADESVSLVGGGFCTFPTEEATRRVPDGARGCIPQGVELGGSSRRETTPEQPESWLVHRVSARVRMVAQDGGLKAQQVVMRES
jgi:hypothetical protein